MLIECPRCSRTGHQRRPIYMTPCDWSDLTRRITRTDWICPRCGWTVIDHHTGHVQAGQHRRAA